MQYMFKNIYVLVLFLYVPLIHAMVTRSTRRNIQQHIDAQTAPNRLILAIQSQSIEEIKKIFQAGFTLDRCLKNVSGNPILFGPAVHGRLDIIILLLQHGALVDEENTHGDTALMMAALRGRTDVVRTLIEFGANPLHTNKAGNTALSYAVKKGCYLPCQLLEPYYTEAYYKKIVGKKFDDINYAPPTQQPNFEPMTTRAKRRVSASGSSKVVHIKNNQVLATP